MTISANVNKMSIAHKGSKGKGIAFPDVCKVPAPPAPPVPTPFPNLAKTDDLSKGTKKVKVDGNSVCIKGCKLSRSSGDIGGTLKGIVSNQNLGKAEFANQSMDVKFEAKAVHRLLDPLQQNDMSPTANALDPGLIQGPVVVVDMDKVGKDQKEACEKVEERKVKNKPPPGEHKEAAKKAGMLEDDYDKMREVCAEQKAIVSFRDSNPDQMSKMAAGATCKPHSLANKSVSAKSLGKSKQDADILQKVDDLDLKGYVGVYDDKGKLTGLLGADGKTEMPIKGMTSSPDPKKMMVGDYDMHDMFDARTGERIRGESDRDFRLREALNDRLAPPEKIKHGAQANYLDFLRKHPDEKPVPSLFQPDPPATAFDGSKKPADVYRLETNEDIVNFYRCQGQETPEEWTMAKKKPDAKVVERVR